MKAPPLGLYVHLPWCERKCPYCDFNSHEREHLPEEAYVTALLADLAGEAATVTDRTVDTVFIGGGTPSLFSAAAIERLLQGISERVVLAPDAEITLEANPGSAEAAKFAAFRRAGVNRLSLGIQSFDDAALERLGRVHDRAQALAAVTAARSAGFDNLNLDLMHGLPQQSREAGLADLETAIALAPEHLSWYQLTIEPNTVFHRRPPVLPGEAILSELESEGRKLLARAGYTRYEVSAWSRPGRRCRHNLGYWTFGDYLAIGAGAHGKVIGSDGRIRRYAKRRQPETYLAADPGTFTASERCLETADLAGEFMLNALRLVEGVPRAHFTAATGLDDVVIAGTIAQLVARGLLVDDPARLATTPLGLSFLDDVVGAFFDA
ncbi:radical SAM family heme chaperone HemW [Pseudohaliea rubra]|uniref:Heme chaperone HemW n=1 Tax=Pseudohaliea rubra DSM 19751 TaxID=1265313 RepID=A0A095VRW8_9GAMM|nr:radical SAM family heme chaperone HemW [Pseudohaliea rubra]KGE04197.1 Radical SAM family enzyme, similar to coproporphyrinogen III oxidase, oxygen-independent [Pseudohaliea rubra DSM 19751]